jgi:site-specific recombinase XerD
VVAEGNAKHEANRRWTFGEFVEFVFFPYYSRKWKHSTRGTTMNRITFHLIGAFRDRELASFKRDELQDLLDSKAASGLSFSVIDHLRWDIAQIFEMAEAEGQVQRNPARLLFTPREAAKFERRVMTIEQVQLCLRFLGMRERLIAELAILAGMRPGEIFALSGRN